MNQITISNSFHLLESIKVEYSSLHNLKYHKERIRNSIKKEFGLESEIDFDPILADVKKLPDITYKLRLVYNQEFFKYEFIPYTISPITSLKLTYSTKINYDTKLLDRTKLNFLFAQRGRCDDILIIKDNMITDTYYCNVALLQNDKWYTPSTPLLPGTKRQQLLDSNIIIETPISLIDLPEYSTIRLFNAMIDFGEIEFSTRMIF